MTLNFIYVYAYFIILAKIYSLIGIIVLPLESGTPVLDTFARVYNDDFIINKLYFFWTNFFYLYYFVITLLTLVVLYPIFYKKAYITPALLIILATHALALEDYWLCTPQILYTNFELLNPLLLNSINKFHPLLFYITTLNVISFSLVSFSVTGSFPQYNCKCAILFKGLLLLLITLCLGSWWAIQEGSWGGWWNWDPSYVLGLLVILQYLSMIHLKQLGFFKKRFIIFLIVASTLLLFIYLLIQLNFDLVSHNFGTRTDTFANLSEVLTLEFVLLVVYVVFLIYFQFRIILIMLVPSNNTLVHNQVLLVAVSVLLYFSFKLLFADYLWQVVALNATNYWFNLKLVVVYLVSALLYYLWNPSLILIGLVPAIGYCLPYNLSLLTVFLSVSFIVTAPYINHLLIVLFLYLSVGTYFKSMLFFACNSLITNCYVSLNCGDVFISKNITEGYSNIEKSSCTPLSTSTDLQWFSKILSQNHIEQVLKNGLLNLNFNVRIFEFGHANLISIFSIVTILSLCDKSSKKLITY